MAFTVDEQRELQSILGSRFNAEQSAAIKKALLFVFEAAYARAQELAPVDLSSDGTTLTLTLGDGSSLSSTLAGDGE